MSFAEATAMTPTADPTVHTGRVLDGWDIGGNANGGYLLALATRAMRDVAGRPDVATITAHYLAPGRPGPVTVTSEVVKTGKRFVTVRSTLADEHRPVLAVLGAFTAHDDGEQVDAPLVEAEPPDLPDPDDCYGMATADSFEFSKRLDLRLHPEDAGFRTGTRTGRARVRGWFRLHDGEPVDSVALVQAVDAFPPTIFNTDIPVAWTPTVELTAHVRSRPAPGWLACDFTTRFVTGGFLEADGLVWDRRGRMVAQSRQLALVPRT